MRDALMQTIADHAPRFGVAPKRRKISGGPRSDAGRRARDTFASLKKTCCKLGVSFWAFLNYRIRGAHGIPSLPALIEARAQSP